MEPTTLARYGLLLVFLNVVLDQSGLPIPAVPILVACGALAARGEISLTSLLLSATAVPGLVCAGQMAGKSRSQDLLPLLPACR